MSSLDALLELLLMLLTEPRTGVLFALLAVAAVIDWRVYKIPNWLTLGGTAFALVYSVFVPFSRDAGILWALGGMLLGFLVMLPMYALRVMGAGDVKLMAMVGAFLGLNDTFYALIFALVAGGVAAILVALLRKSMWRMVRNIKRVVQAASHAALGGMKPQVYLDAGDSVGKLPYGVSICAGTVIYLVAKQLGYA
jgi:prepilin peptidase CpaA